MSKASVLSIEYNILIVKWYQTVKFGLLHHHAVFILTSRDTRQNETKTQDFLSSRLVTFAQGKAKKLTGSGIKW